MAEKRQKRKNCRIVMKVLDAESDELLGYLFNLSIDGLMISGETVVETASDFKLKIILPAKIKGTTELTVDAKSRWCEPEEDNPSFFNTGFKLVDPPRQEVKILKQMMKKYCF